MSFCSRDLVSLLQWDVSYWAERLKEAKYSISDEELRPYFALPNVLDGLFKVGGPKGGAGSEPGREGASAGKGVWRSLGVCTGKRKR
jgi:hypothetical protein